MSAYVVDKSHIDALIRAAQQASYGGFAWRYKGEWHKLQDANLDTVGQMLLDECVKSVSHRYDDSEITDLPGRCDAEWLIPYRFSPLGKVPTGVEAIKIAQCYEYQSCEHPEWEESEAHAFAEALIRGSFFRLPGYDDAPWDWEETRPRTLPVRIV